jgi:hypothetical protein
MAAAGSRSGMAGVQRGFIFQAQFQRFQRGAQTFFD